MNQQPNTNTNVYHLIFYNKPGFEILGFTHMHNIVFDIHIFSMNRCKWMKKSQLQQKIGPAKAKQSKGEMQQLIIASQRYHEFLYQSIIVPMYFGFLRFQYLLDLRALKCKHVSYVML